MIASISYYAKILLIDYASLTLSTIANLRSFLSRQHSHTVCLVKLIIMLWPGSEAAILHPAHEASYSAKWPSEPASKLHRRLIFSVYHDPAISSRLTISIFYVVWQLSAVVMVMQSLLSQIQRRIPPL
jgi:hypothetical protein